MRVVGEKLRSLFSAPSDSTPEVATHVRASPHARDASMVECLPALSTDGTRIAVSLPCERKDCLAILFLSADGWASRWRAVRPRAPTPDER